MPAREFVVLGLVMEVNLSVVDEYAPDTDRPLGGYAALMGLYGVSVAAGAVGLRRRNGPLPDVRLTDVVLTGVATHKLARRMSKDSVTSPLRAPFTRYEGVSARPNCRNGAAAGGSGSPSANWSAAPSASASGWLPGSCSGS